MNLNEYVNMWDKYFSEALESKNYIPSDCNLKKYYDSYDVLDGEYKKEVDYIPEPFLGDINNAKVVIINTNPGGVAPFQKWQNGEIVNYIKNSIKNGSKSPYSDLAKNFIYINEDIDFNTEKTGKNFWKSRLNYINSVVENDISKENIAAFEIYPWHSKRFKKEKLKNRDLILKEFILEPIMDMDNVDYVFFLRSPIVEAMKDSGIKFDLIQHAWESKALKVFVANYKGKVFIGTINNQTGYPKIDGNDIKHLREIVKKYKENK